MKEQIDMLCGEWEDKVYTRYAYCFGEETVFLDAFADLFKRTLELIRKVNNDFIYKKGSVSDPAAVMSYLCFVATMAKYTRYDTGVDRSRGKCFTATCLVAEKLVHYATNVGSFSFENSQVICGDDEEGYNGEFTFYRDDYQECSYEENTSHTYHVFDGDFSDLLKLAAVL